MNLSRILEPEECVTRRNAKEVRSTGYLKRNLLAENQKHERSHEAVRSPVVGRGLALAEEQEVAQSLEDVRNQEDGHIHQTALNQEGDRNRDEKDLRALLLQHRIHLLLLIVAVKRNSLSLVDDIEVCHLRSLRKRNDQKVRKSAIDQWNRLVDHIVQLEREIHDTIDRTENLSMNHQ